MAFKKVTAGQPLGRSPARSASWLNAVTDLVNRSNERGERPGGSGSTLVDYPNVIKVKNLTGAARALGHVVSVGAYLLGTTQPQNKWFEGNAISTTFSPFFAILAKPAASMKSCQRMWAASSQ